MSCSAARGSVLVAFSVWAASGVASGHPRFTATWQPVTLVRAVWQFEFETAVSRLVSLHLTPSVIFVRDMGSVSPHAFGVDFGARLFPLGRSPRGFFLGWHVGVMDSYMPSGPQPAKGFGVRTGPSLGYTLIVCDRLVLSGGLGFEFSRFRDDRALIARDPVLLPFVRLAAGVAF